MLNKRFSPNQKGIALPVVIIVIVLVVAGLGVGYYFGLRAGVSNQLSVKLDEAIVSPSIEPQEASSEVMVKVGTDPSEPAQSQNIDPNKLYTLKDLSFKMPHRWWSRYVKSEPNESYFLGPNQLCWNCGGNSEINIHYMPNKSLVEQQESLITGLYLKDTTKKNINISNRTGVLFEGRIEPEMDTPLQAGEIAHIFMIQVNQDLYEITSIGSKYKTEFDTIISSLVIK